MTNAMNVARSMIWSTVAAIAWTAMPASAQTNELDRYVAKKESVYGWKVESSAKSGEHSVFVLNLTSQTCTSQLIANPLKERLARDKRKRPETMAMCKAGSSSN